MMKMLKKADILLILTLLVLSMAPLVSLADQRPDNLYADITVDGKLERRIPLSAHQGREVFTIQTADGSNTVCVEDASIAVISADCSDAVCVNTGKASHPGDIIACLPHRLIIEVKGSTASQSADEELIRTRSQKPLKPYIWHC